LGSHVVTSRRGHLHHGIDIGGGKIVHYAGLARGLRRGPVEQVSVAHFADGLIAMPTLNVNGKSVAVDVPADTPILWTLRDELGLTGTKFGCGMALCGACTVHLDGVATRSPSLLRSVNAFADCRAAAS